MSGSWIRKIRDFFRSLFGQRTEKDALQTRLGEDIPMQTAPLPDLSFIERIRSQALDKSLRVYSRRHPDIRVVAVKSFGDAYRHLLRMCDQSLLTCRYAFGHYYYTVTLPEEYGQLVLTDNVGFCKDGAIAVLKINVAGILPFVKEIRYRITE